MYLSIPLVRLFRFFMHDSHVILFCIVERFSHEPLARKIEQSLPASSKLKKKFLSYSIRTKGLVTNRGIDC